MTIRAAIFTVNFVALTCIAGPTFGAQPTLHNVELKKNVQLPNDQTPSAIIIFTFSH